MNSWQPSEITALFCVDDVKKKLTDEGNQFDSAFYVIAWESKFGALDKLAEQQLMPHYKRQRHDLGIPRNTLKINHNANLSRYFQKRYKVTQESPKASLIVAQSVPQETKTSNFPVPVILTRTIAFTLYINESHPDAMSNPQIRKKTNSGNCTPI